MHIVFDRTVQGIHQDLVPLGQLAATLRWEYSGRF
jgi:hypothetical protein